MRLALLCLFSLAVVAIFTTCGDDGDTGAGPGTPPPPLKVSFLDCRVEGLEWEAGSSSGWTDANGECEGAIGEVVTFSFGDIVIGEGIAGPNMTPVDLTFVTRAIPNIARLLQTIDDDHDPASGILITAAVRTAAAGLSVDFNQYGSDFESDANVISVVNTLTTATSEGARTLIDVVTAMDHLNATLLRTMAGNYRGSCYEYQITGEGPAQMGEEIGDWFITVDSDGNITGEYDPDHDHEQDEEITGLMQSNGNFECSGKEIYINGFVARDAQEGLNKGKHVVTGSWNSGGRGGLSPTQWGDILGEKTYYAPVECP